MEKNSSIYNNKRFAQRTNNYGDYERSPLIPEPGSRAMNWRDFLQVGRLKSYQPADSGFYYPDSIINARAFLNYSIYIKNPKFIEEIEKFISYMKMLNNNIGVYEIDRPKSNWLKINQQPIDQYNEFTNWSQSERQKYSSRFNTMLGTKRGAILQKALVALKNAEIAAAKVSFPRDERVKEAKYMSDAADGTADASGETSNQTPSSEKPRRNQPSSSQSVSRPSEEKPEKTYEKFNISYIPFIKKIKKENHLLFFAAMQALGIKIGDYKKENELFYYTKDNYNKIESEIIKIADSEYLNGINSSLSSLKQGALKLLNDRVNKQPEGPKTPEGSEESTKPEGTSVTVKPEDRNGRSTAVETTSTGNYPTPGKEDLYDISSFGADAQEFIRDTVQPLKDMAEKDLVSFKLQGQQRINEAVALFNSIKGKLSSKEIFSIDTMLNNLQAKYMSAYSETGLSRAGRSFAVVDYREAAQEAFSLFDRKIYLKDQIKIQEKRDQLEKILNIYQTKFINKHPGDYYIEQYIAPLNDEIGFWNFRYSNMNPKNNTNIEMLDKLRPAPRF
jgi:hypothetical protein